MPTLLQLQYFALQVHIFKKRVNEVRGKNKGFLALKQMIKTLYVRKIKCE